MPFYEYWCSSCGRKVGLYLKTSEQCVVCPRCASGSLKRLFSTFSVRTTDHDIFDNILSDSQLVKGMMANDPRSLADWNRRMSRGEEPGAEYQEMVERMERGESPNVSQGEQGVGNGASTDAED
ncbi:MAG: FmdB family zinc ribbon protein [Chloroflexota bacterium]